MNVLIAFIHSALLLFTVSCVYANQGLEIDDSCLSVEERVKWTRSLHFNNQSFSLNIDVNDRPSHWIINYIFEILLRERLGYRDINFIYTPWDSSSTVISRLNCEISRNCSRPPPVHVNLEVWLRTGEEINKHAPPHRVRINGPLGPITRWGLYGSHDALDLLNTARTDPKSHRLHQNQSIDTGVLFYDHPTMFEAYKNLSEDSVYLGLRPERQFTQSLWNITARGSGLDRVALLLSWYPSTLTLNPRLVRLGLPDCAALRARTSINSAVDSSCAFEVNRLVKASWAGLAEAAPLVSQLIDRFQIRQTEYIELLRVVDPSLLNYTDAEQKNQEVKFRSRYREIACRWLRMHRSTWKHWTEGWNVKKEIIIGGMFTFTGTEEFNDLAPNAFHAVDVLNGDEKYFGNSEFAIRLQVRNLTCSQNVVLNDFFNFLTVNPNNESVLGVILALCPDAIEATVRLANLRRVLVISPTVESASFLWRKHYKFFFRTIPSAYTASFIFIRLFQQWRWKRVAMFRKDDHYFYRDAFIANNISLVDDFEVKESMLTYSVALKNVRSVKQRNGRIIIVDHSAAATAIILCAAFHLNMRAEKGYVWFLSPWLSKNFWESPEVVPRECSAGDLKIMHDYSFSVSHPLHTGAVTHSNPMTPMSGFNRSSDASNGAKSEMRIRSHQRQLYEQCTFESVIVLGSAIARLLRENPSSLSVLNSPKMAERLRTFVSKTHMEYSNRGYLDKNAVSFFSNNVERLGETLVYRLGVTPPSPPIPPQTPLPSYDEDPPASTVHQLSFDSHNDRLLEAWLLKQIQDKTTVPITLWSFTGPHEGETEYESTPGSDDIHRMHASGGVARSKADAASDWGDDNGEGEDNGGEVNRNDAIAFKTFVDNLIEKPYDKPRWGGGGSTPPTDGSITDADCTFAFISRWFGVSCVVGNWIFAMGVLLIVVVPVVAIVLAYFRRRLQEAEKLTRRPYEELCALLADVNIPLSDIVINRRIGDGAFGLVYGGEAKFAGRWEAVAVKMNTNRTTYEAKVEFLSEAKLMRDLRHKNVVRLVGVCMHRPQDEIYLIMELMLLGDLKKYLLERRLTAQRCPDHEDICPATLTRMALDIAEGLAYLHSKQLIHRDIACRNCLVGPDHVVKVGDFGLTREATAGSPYGYYRFTRNVELPIRWMPPEAVQFGIFSVKSDLWSYGIVLYEIITFGMFPYVELGDVEVVERVKRSEFSITQILPPAANGTTVWRLIVSCCQYYWQHRPESMLQVIEEIRANGNCIRPYLTDEPPTLETTAIPFLPGPAACIMPEPPSVPQPAFSAPMGARAWVGGAPFMNPSAPFTDPPSMGDGQRHTAANGSGGGGGGACVVEGHKVSPSANSSASLTSNSSKPCNFPPPITVGQSPPRRVQPPMSVYAPPGPPSYQPLDEFRPLLNPTNRSLSLEFLQKSAFHVHSRPPSFLKGNADENTSDGDEDTEAGDVLSPGRGTSHQCTSCPQKTSLVTRNIPPPTPDAVVGPAGRRHHGNFFARTFAAALDSCSKPHPRRSAGLPSFLRGDQASSMRLRLLPSLRHHQPPPSRNELASKSLPQVSGANCHTTKPSCGGVRTSSTGGRTGAGSRIACSSAGDAHLLARPTLSDSSSSANRRPSPSTVTQNGAAGIVISGSSPNFAYHPPPPDSLV